jgi:DNA polymerase-3 subunit delta'
MLFKEVIGHKEIRQKLIRTVKDNRISHAQLFLGPEGSGNLALALAYAQYISCLDRKDDDSCGVCSSCRKYAKLIHPDLHFVFPVAATKEIPKDPVSNNFMAEWREIVIENPYLTLLQWYEKIGVENKQGIISVGESKEIIRKLSLKTFESEFKIMIIWMPGKMNVQAANKLLKILEEPQGNTVFLLIDGSTEQFLPTILSRTQIIKITRIDEQSLIMALKEKFDCPEKEIINAARLADGNLIRGIEYIEKSEETKNNFNRFVQLMRLAYSGDMIKISEWIEEVSVIGREKQKNFLVNALRLIRGNFLLNLENRELVRLSDEEMEFSEKFSAFVNQHNAFDITEEINKACLHIEANANPKVVFLDLAIQLKKRIR